MHKSLTRVFRFSSVLVPSPGAPTAPKSGLHTGPGKPLRHILSILLVDIILEIVRVAVAVQPELKPAQEVLALTAGANTHIREAPHLTGARPGGNQLIGHATPLIHELNTLVPQLTLKGLITQLFFVLLILPNPAVRERHGEGKVFVLNLCEPVHGTSADALRLRVVPAVPNPQQKKPVRLRQAGVAGTLKSNNVCLRNSRPQVDILLSDFSLNTLDHTRVFFRLIDRHKNSSK